MTGILFDLDGTLLDTLDDLTDSVNFALARFGLPPRTRVEVRQFVGNGAGLLIHRAVDGRAEETAVLAAFRAHYECHCQDKTAPYPGILQALEKLRYPIAIVSNKPDSAVKRLCGFYFHGVYACGETNGCPRKPNPAMLKKAMAHLGVETAVYVGDSEVDIQTAENASMPCLSVLWGFRDRTQLKAASHICSDPNSLPHALEAMIGEYYGK